MRDTLGYVLDKQGKHEEAEPQFRQALRSTEKSRGPENLETLRMRGSSGQEPFVCKEKIVRPKSNFASS